MGPVPNSHGFAKSHVTEGKVTTALNSIPDARPQEVGEGRAQGQPDEPAEAHDQPEPERHAAKIRGYMQHVLFKCIYTLGRQVVKKVM